MFIARFSQDGTVAGVLTISHGAPPLAVRRGQESERSDGENDAAQLCSSDTVYLSPACNPGLL